MQDGLTRDDLIADAINALLLILRVDNIHDDLFDPPTPSDLYLNEDAYIKAQSQALRLEDAYIRDLAVCALATFNDFTDAAIQDRGLTELAAITSTLWRLAHRRMGLGRHRIEQSLKRYA
jgi:hypothetical protein